MNADVTLIPYEASMENSMTSNSPDYISRDEFQAQRELINEIRDEIRDEISDIKKILKDQSIEIEALKFQIGILKASK